MEVQQLERELASESEALQKNVKSLHTPTFIRSLKRKVQLINWTKGPIWKKSLTEVQSRICVQTYSN